MDNYELVEKWLAIFGKDVDKKVINDHVTSYGNHLWHLFTWGNVPCILGDEARKAFDALDYAEAIRFYDGYSNHVDKISVIEKISAKKDNFRQNYPMIALRFVHFVIFTIDKENVKITIKSKSDR